MSVCKLCQPMKVFKKLTPTHLKKKHGIENRAEYDELTKDIEIPADIQAEDDKLIEKIKANHYTRRKPQKSKGSSEKKKEPKPIEQKPMTIADRLAMQSKKG